MQTSMNALLNPQLTSCGAKKVRHELIAMQQGYHLDASAYTEVAVKAGFCYGIAPDDAALMRMLANLVVFEQDWANAYGIRSCQHAQCVTRATLYGMLLRCLNEETR